MGTAFCPVYWSVCYCSKRATLIFPYSSLESIIEKNKNAYYLAFQRTQKTLKYEKIDRLPWLRFFLNALKRQKDHLIEKTKGFENYADLPYESVLIMQYLDVHDRITIKEAAKLYPPLFPE